MTNDRNALRDDYIARLDAAMRDLPLGVATDIRAGILEELSGLDAEGTALRIARLGEPEAVAQEARSELPQQAASVAAPPARVPYTRSRGFAIAAAIVLGLGGFAVPFAGWVVGAGMVCASRLWRGWEKAVGILVPFAVVVLGMLVTWIIGLATAAGSEGTENPLVPAALSGWHLSILSVLIVVPVGGAWLLWRLRGRAER